MLNKQECQTIHERNAGKRVWLEFLCANDGRLVLMNEDETLHTWLAAEYDQEEQAQAARLCAAVNQARDKYGPLVCQP